LKKKEDRSAEELIQLVEIINAKCDTGELQEIVNKESTSEHEGCNHDFFYQELRVIAEDSVKPEDGSPSQ
jgi:hypothetical protein